MQLIFKIQKANLEGRSKVDLILKDKNKIQKMTANDTDEILQTLDKLLKGNKIELEDIKDIKLEISKKAGLTSQRIVKAIIKALRLNL